MENDRHFSPRCRLTVLGLLASFFFDLYVEPSLWLALFTESVNGSCPHGLLEASKIVHGLELIEISVFFLPAERKLPLAEFMAET